MSHRIFFSVGEPSGDLHAAKLIRQLQRLSPGTSTLGLGGPMMEQADCQILYRLTELAVVGLIEVVPKLKEFYRVAHLASRALDEFRPDAVVLVDFPGFNWHIAKRAKQRGIPVFYYLPPQLWAWGSWRLAKLKRNVDHVLCNLPFEQQWFEERGVQAEYIGHPFFDEVHERTMDRDFIQRWSGSNRTLVAVLPGSRSREVSNIWPIQMAAIRSLAPKHPQTVFLVACLQEKHRSWCQQQLTDQDRSLNLQFEVGKTSEIIQLADCALTKSGSVSLELMARGTPSVVVYHVGRILYQIASRLTKIQTFTLPNLLAGRSVMSEHLAVGSIQQAIISSTASLDLLLTDPAERQRQRQELLELSASIAHPGASSRAAERILSRLSEFEKIAIDQRQVA